MRYNPKNERIKREYFHYLKEARRRGESSIDAAAMALRRFEEFSRWRDFGRFHREQAVAFKSSLAERTAIRSKDRLSWSTIQASLRELKGFFLWLAGQPGYKSKLRYDDADYFNLSEKDLSLARAKGEKRVPTLEHMHAVLNAMPDTSILERRSRAIVAFSVLTGARARATTTFKLRHLDLERRVVRQDALVVQTKFSKTFSTWFFPVGDLPLQILSEWVQRLRRELGRADDDPLFPATQNGLGDDGGFEAVGLSRQGWKSTQPIRDAFKEGCRAAELPYFNPHSVRDMLVLMGERLCETPEQFKAWSQNLGHNGVLTSLTSYGRVPEHRQAEIIARMSRSTDESDPLQDDEVRRMLRDLAKRVGSEHSGRI